MPILPDSPNDANILNEDDVAHSIAQEIDALALAIDSPKAIADSLVDFIKRTYPAYVSTAYWITLSHEHERDKGIAVEILKLPILLQVKAVLGSWSGGIEVVSRPFDVALLHAKFAVGAGVATPYADAGRLLPFVGFNVMF